MYTGRAPRAVLGTGSLAGARAATVYPHGKHPSPHRLVCGGTRRPGLRGSVWWCTERALGCGFLSGYDSELEAEANEDYIRDPKPQQVRLSSLNVTPLTRLRRCHIFDTSVAREPDSRDNAPCTLHSPSRGSSLYRRPVQCSRVRSQAPVFGQRMMQPSQHRVLHLHRQ